MQNFQSSNKRTPEVKSLKEVKARQHQEIIVPQNHEFLIETFETRGYHLVFYPFKERLVHMAMAGLIAYRISLLQPIRFSLAYNNYDFEILSN